MFIDTTKKWFLTPTYDTFSKNGINRATLLLLYVYTHYYLTYYVQLYTELGAASFAVPILG